jgi:hypothetical protein
MCRLIPESFSNKTLSFNKTQTWKKFPPKVVEKSQQKYDHNIHPANEFSGFTSSER